MATGAETLGHSPLLSQAHEQEAVLEVEQLGLELHGSITGHGLTCYVIVLAPWFSILIQNFSKMIKGLLEFFSLILSFLWARRQRHG